MPTAGVIVNEFADEMPKVSRPGAGAPRQRTDVDVALDQLKAEFDQSGSPSRALKVIDYKLTADGDAVDPKTAATRAQARVQANRKRGYTKEDGWELRAIDGALWARYHGPGNHPQPESKSSNGQADVAPGQVPAPPTVPAV